MKIKLLVVGKTSARWLQEGMEVYQKRLSHYAEFSLVIIPDIKAGGGLLQDVLRNKESDALLKQIDDRDTVVLLDEGGKRFSSEAFALQLEKWQVRSEKQIVFVIGGAFGFGEQIIKRSVMKLSLSDMTFSHQMVRLIFLEQLYRAFTILKGEPYHHR